ncbi:type VI secretion system baseplate subunit TssK [Pseudomonas sp. GD03860]|uniref:type VI secretion system baseplate subunit TssK n=1 Tax=Pseudomonas TaxID=286 RepID=UPI0023634BC4|nr:MULTISPECIES: type VI secretion system baseplate subunit TssK [Pseudomonas]MDD2058588.1 type VI secretion system baseplate subunit TssK [Pseudomonas putida]MDH0639547.1 type VI secretion system baseplate subunit TssK [Pseudomonas sp. GD03860]
MFNDDRVVWSEGMFLQPQHFQQQQRHVRGQQVRGLNALQADSWGFTALRIDPAQLAMGRIRLLECAGILPDGTLFELDAQALVDVSFVVGEGARELDIVLALPALDASSREVERDPAAGSLVRYRLYETATADNTVESSEQATLQLARLNLQLALRTDVARTHEYLGVARVLERSPNGQVRLDPVYIPPILDWQLSPQLTAGVDDLLGRIRQRGFMLAKHMGTPGLGGVAEVQHFLMLQSINRAEALLAHLTRYPGAHPEALLRELLGLAGELAIFSDTSKRVKTYPSYRHDQLAESFAALIEDLLHCVSEHATADVVPLVLKDREHGIRFAAVHDSELYGMARFVLGVRAQIPDDELRAVFPVRLKIGPAEQVGDLVDLQLPGLSIGVLPAAPRELPFYAGFTYFEVHRDHPLWQALTSSSGFGLHVAGDLPGLQLAFWAIKEGQ